jgi:hypothetical protein
MEIATAGGLARSLPATAKSAQGHAKINLKTELMA